MTKYNVRYEENHIPDNEKVVLDRPEWATHYAWKRWDFVFLGGPLEGEMERYSKPIPDGCTRAVVLNDYDTTWNHLRQNVEFR